MENSDILMYVLYYLGGGAGAGGITWLNFRRNFAGYVEKYGKNAVMGIIAVMVLFYPIAIVVAGLMYWGKTTERAKKKEAEAQSTTESSSQQ